MADLPTSSAATTRPLLRYLGSKWRLAPWIIGHMPATDIYVEPFGGAAAVLLQREPVRTEVYNDLDDELVNLFRVLRSPAAPELIRQIAFTPYARVEYLASFEPSDDPVEQARRTIVRSHMSHGNMSLRRSRPSGFRIDGTTGVTSVGQNWADLPEAIHATIRRRGLVASRTRTCRHRGRVHDIEEPRLTGAGESEARRLWDALPRAERAAVRAAAWKAGQ